MELAKIVMPSSNNSRSREWRGLWVACHLGRSTVLGYLRRTTWYAWLTVLEDENDTQGFESGVAS
jgi:hypothetical protein